MLWRCCSNTRSATTCDCLGGTSGGFGLTPLLAVVVQAGVGECKGAGPRPRCPAHVPAARVRAQTHIGQSSIGMDMNYLVISVYQSMREC